MDPNAATTHGLKPDPDQRDFFVVEVVAPLQRGEAQNQISKLGIRVGPDPTTCAAALRDTADRKRLQVRDPV